MDSMKMYVWQDVLTDCTSGLAVAMAYSEDEARELLLQRAESFERDRLAHDITKPPDEVYDEPAGVFIWGGG